MIFYICAESVKYHNTIIFIYCQALWVKYIVIFDWGDTMLGQMIKKLRLERGLKQEDLGRRVGASKQSVSNWENENIMPSIDMLLRLADYFNVTTDYLLGREPTRSLDAEGLDGETLSHLQLLINDIRSNKSP